MCVYLCGVWCATNSDISLYSNGYLHGWLICSGFEYKDVFSTTVMMRTTEASTSMSLALLVGCTVLVGGERICYNMSYITMRQASIYSFRLFFDYVLAPLLFP